MHVKFQIYKSIQSLQKHKINFFICLVVLESCVYERFSGYYEKNMGFFLLWVHFHFILKKKKGSQSSLPHMNSVAAVMGTVLLLILCMINITFFRDTPAGPRSPLSPWSPLVPGGPGVPLSPVSKRMKTVNGGTREVTLRKLYWHIEL